MLTHQYALDADDFLDAASTSSSEVLQVSPTPHVHCMSHEASFVESSIEDLYTFQDFSAIPAFPIHSMHDNNICALNIQGTSNQELNDELTLHNAPATDREQITHIREGSGGRLDQATKSAPHEVIDPPSPYRHGKVGLLVAKGTNPPIIEDTKVPTCRLANSTFVALETQT